MGSERDLAAARIAAKQKTLLTTGQLVACGLGNDAVRYRIGTGRLHPVFRGVLSMGCGALPPLGKELAALLACGKGSFVSHRSAAFVWRLLKTPPEEVEVSVVGRYCDSRKGIHVHRIGAIDRRDLRSHEGLWVSSPARALLEIATGLRPDELAEALGEAIALRLVNRDVLEALMHRHRGRRGVARLAAVMGDESAMTITRSRAEKAMLKLIRDAKLPRPQVNERLGPYRPDFMWPEHRLIVEIDSYTFHGGPDGYHRDREKDLYYRDAGFDVLRFTRQHVIHEPMMVLVRLAQALTQRSRP